jgi:formylglycine-generating enzyme required for sulfatase activity
VPGNPDSYSGRSPYYGDATYADYPVIDVNWQQAADFCTWVGGRLPTEAEWEYAARGGLSGKRFPWGDTIDCTKANYLTSESYTYDVDPYVGSGFCATPGDTTQVGSYAANGYGLYDMAGNVWEWVSDWYSSSYYSSSPSSDPQGPVSGTNRVLRGGSFYDSAYDARVANRLNVDPTNQYINAGFRCAR